MRSYRLHTAIANCVMYHRGDFIESLGIRPMSFTKFINVTTLKATAVNATDIKLQRSNKMELTRLEEEVKQ